MMSGGGGKWGRIVNGKIESYNGAIDKGRFAGIKIADAAVPAGAGGDTALQHTPSGMSFPSPPGSQTSDAVTPQSPLHAVGSAPAVLPQTPTTPGLPVRVTRKRTAAAISATLPYPLASPSTVPTTTPYPISATLVVGATVQPDTVVYNQLKGPSTAAQMNVEKEHVTKRIKEAKNAVEEKGGNLVLISFEELKLYDVLGEGAFGTVHRAEWNQKVVAVKVLKNQHLSSKARAQFMNELQLMNRLKHPNIAEFLGACTGSPLCMVTAFYQFGSLFHYLHQRRPKPSLSLERQLRLCLGVARGLMYLHAHDPPIIHRDLKPANLLLDDNLNIRLADFGLSRDTALTATMTGAIGTPHYMAPEVILESHYTEQADIYSLGIIMWEILTRDVPYRGMNTIQIAMKVVSANHRPVFAPECGVPEPLKKLAEDCWDKDVGSRPNCAGVVQRLLHYAHTVHADIS
eukprot:TRINITY_DN2727_c0_g1_i1.p1 TRINITY_DN2727_c0_g1~~TRINITY_DN2727_c0_g1_i1.p1  ORF type:complete len:459 (+),score=104.23 TRINITY_DN2727_c0_g1_i1:362-1738(+)